MNREEVAEIVHGMPQGMDADDYLVELVNRALAKREWVGLTREDKDDLVHALPEFYSMEHVILATEAKLKRLNT